MADKTIYYAGIGARSTPDDVLELMTQIGEELALHGLVLRSGAATGADSAFEKKVIETHKQIFLPWQGYNNHLSEWYSPSDEAYHIASLFHPNWPACTETVQRFMARNSHQVLGPSLNDHSSFIICWTPGGKGGGGTGQAIRVARGHNIPVFDMGELSMAELVEKITPYLEK